LAIGDPGLHSTHSEDAITLIIRLTLTQNTTGVIAMSVSIPHVAMEVSIHDLSIGTVEGTALIQFPKVEDHRGNLSVIEAMRHVPFPIKRVYYVYDVPSGVIRGGHAHKSLHQCIIPACGSFTVFLDNGTSSKTILLDRPGYGLYVPPMIWGDLGDFSPGSLCLVLASEVYDESDYFRNYEEFRQALRNPGEVDGKSH
jgi:dTDP-4-dehydrorhamnose 3,5-epimerase-like enzyme